MRNNGLYVVIAILAVIAIVLGAYVWREESKSGLEINVGEDGISVQEN